MNETLRNLWGRLRLVVDRFSPRQRRNIAIAVVSAILCLVVILWVVLRPNYVTVMSGLDASSLGQVQTELETLKIPNKIQGSAVLVPKAQADTARVQLAQAGLPKSGYIGYSSISNNFGMTQDQFNIQVLDLLQQSLDQTIQSIDGINSAQVHIVMPDQQVFVSQPTSTAKASVFVEVAPGVQLSGTQVAGIQQLVAHSVKGLTTDNVSVVDQNGVTLSNSGGVAGTANAGGNELSIRQNLDSQEQQLLLSELNRIVGSGNAVVTVHANVSFNQVKSTSHEVQPAPGQSTGLISSQQTNRTSSNSTGQSGTGGVAGQSSSNPNSSSYASSGSGGGNSQSTQTESTTNYDNGYTNTTTVADPIQINGYSVGVFLNSSDKSLTPQVIAQIKQFVTNAVGAKAGKGSTNSVFVSKVPFQALPTSGLTAGRKSNAWLWGGLGAGAVVLFAGVLLFRRRKRTQDAAETLEPQTVQELADDLEKVGLSEDEQMKLQLAKLASQKPEEFANLVRTWLVGD